MSGHLLEKHRVLLDLLADLSRAVNRVFTDSREGLEVIDVDEYMITRDLILRLSRTLDAEVHRVCFEERLSNRSCCGGD
jgi:hypothetical protein